MTDKEIREQAIKEIARQLNGLSVASWARLSVSSQNDYLSDAEEFLRALKDPNGKWRVAIVRGGASWPDSPHLIGMERHEAWLAGCNAMNDAGFVKEIK